jgi:hypothetical protein
MRRLNSEETEELEIARVMLKTIGQVCSEEGLPCTARVTMLLKEINGRLATPRVEGDKPTRPAGVRGRP